MGRRNRLYRQTITVLVELDAPDGQEAGRRMDDVADALTNRFPGMEIYRQFISDMPRRIAGHPTFQRFERSGRPVEVDPFEVIGET